MALSYQWRVDGGDVPGATAASNTTPRQDVSSDGTKYDVVIRDPFGGVTTSAPATLTVNPGGFWSTGDMLVSRASHTATALANGKVLIAGGCGTASAELFDPEAGHAPARWERPGDRRHRVRRHLCRDLPLGAARTRGAGSTAVQSMGTASSVCRRGR